MGLCVVDDDADWFDGIGEAARRVATASALAASAFSLI
jgi:hypothetical protein